MLKFIQRNAWCCFAGLGLSRLGYTVVTWQWWAYLLPLMFLVFWYKYSED